MGAAERGGEVKAEATASDKQKGRDLRKFDRQSVRTQYSHTSIFILINSCHKFPNIFY